MPGLDAGAYNEEFGSFGNPNVHPNFDFYSYFIVKDQTSCVVDATITIRF